MENLKALLDAADVLLDSLLGTGRVTTRLGGNRRSGEPVNLARRDNAKEFREPVKPFETVIVTAKGRTTLQVFERREDASLEKILFPDAKRSPRRGGR